MYKNITLFSLQTFSTTGGIQKMTRTLAHALNQICKKNKGNFQLISLYDDDSDLMPQYVAQENFSGYGGMRISFMLKNLFFRKKADVIILSHINLALIGLLIKFFSPKTQLWLIAHGIEVWRPISFHKKKLLSRCDKILCVSNYTRSQLYDWHKIKPDKCIVLNNALDPFMKIPVKLQKPAYLMDRYGITGRQTVIFTLTRLASTEMYKGYDRVLKAIAGLKEMYPAIKYILAGKYDEPEGARVKQLITDMNIKDQVILPGFINEEELPDHFLLANLFVLPSRKEGFGIVFIEALACGLPVICGNADGSMDAIRNGELGVAIDADSDSELAECISEHLNKPISLDNRMHIKDKCLQYFSEENYIKTLQNLLKND